MLLFGLSMLLLKWSMLFLSTKLARHFLFPALIGWNRFASLAAEVRSILVHQVHWPKSQANLFLSAHWATHIFEGGLPDTFA